MATVDTLYDLAFLLMDLDRHKQRPAANVVLNRYLWLSGTALDLRGLIALPLFLSLRAAVRAIGRGIFDSVSRKVRQNQAARDYTLV